MRRSAIDRYGLFVLAIFVALVSLGLLAVAFLALRDLAGLGLFLVAMAAVTGGCAFLVLREGASLLGTRVAIFGDTLELDLPGRRGYVVAKPFHRTFKLATIAGIEKRQEAFRAAGTTVLQNAFALKLVDGTNVLLGADRRFVEVFYARAAEEIAQRARLPITDKGMVEGSAGKLLFWGQSAPAWDAPALAPDAAALRLRQEAQSWRMVWIVLALCGLAVTISNFL